MPYRKLDRTELLEEAGLDEDDDVTTWEEAFPGVLLLGEGFRLLSVVALGSRGNSSGLNNKQQRQKKKRKHRKLTLAFIFKSAEGSSHCCSTQVLVNVISVSVLMRLENEHKDILLCCH